MSYALGDRLELKRQKSEDAPKNVSYRNNGPFEEEFDTPPPVHYDDHGVVLGSVHDIIGPIPSTINDGYISYGRHNPPITKGVITDAVNFFLDGCQED